MEEEEENGPGVEGRGGRWDMVGWGFWGGGYWRIK